MAKYIYTIAVKDETEYAIEADSVEEAKMRAVEWWIERNPELEVISKELNEE